MKNIYGQKERKIIINMQKRKKFLDAMTSDKKI
jgi:hypothetical protein